MRKAILLAAILLLAMPPASASMFSHIEEDGSPTCGEQEVQPPILNEQTASVNTAAAISSAGEKADEEAIAPVETAAEKAGKPIENVLEDVKIGFGNGGGTPSDQEPDREEEESSSGEGGGSGDSGEDDGSGDSGGGSSPGSPSNLIREVVSLVVDTAESVILTVSGIANDVVAMLFPDAGGSEQEAKEASVPVAVETGVISASAIFALSTLFGILYVLISKLAIVPLYVKIPRSDMLKNENRRKVYEIIRSRPGICVTELSREVDMGWGTVLYHISALRRSDLIAISLKGKRRYLFENGSTYRQEEKKLIAASRNENAARIIECIRQNPGITQQEICKSLGYTSSLVSWHVKQLEHSGIVSKERCGKTCRHTLSTAASGI
ncbi:MAG: hypothetical protein CVT47_03025 [Thermoplasmata archaeon HGW-Thermoplasmata-2]|nr:MAG: hypothetical protein CVT47_03025 [Thermoplasmata archaeon HGW-Thermoplasmata-2]